jgi:predicted dehydrogenase
MIDTQHLRVGLVGCGSHGSALAQAVARCDSLQLVACADPDEAAIGRIAQFATGVRMYDSVAELLGLSSVDLVVVATPHHLLAPVALAAVRAGKHVLVEKPVAMDEREARELELAAERAGVWCMAGYSFRFSLARHVHELVAAGAVGEIQALTGSIGTGPMNHGWLASSETGGGPLLYVGCHLIDLLLWLTGDEPVSVHADIRRRPDNGTDDTSAIQVRLSTGILGQFLVTQAAHGFFYDLHVQGRSGSITVRGRNFLQFEIEVVSSVVAAYREPTVIRPSIRRDNISMMLVPELESFALSIRENRAPAITMVDGRRVLQVLDAVVESGRRGRPVDLPAPMLAAH